VVKSATTAESASVQTAVNASVMVVALAGAMIVVIVHATTGLESTIAGMQEMVPLGRAEVPERPASGAAGSRTLIVTYLVVPVATTKMQTVMVSEIARRGREVGVETEMEIETGTKMPEGVLAVVQGVEIGAAGGVGRRAFAKASFSVCITTEYRLLISRERLIPTIYETTKNGPRNS
jgi:hypothetical protein